MLSDLRLVPSHVKYGVILMHGYGSNAEDMISLAQELTPALPQTAFFAPNAPVSLEENAYEWFSLSDFQGAETITFDYLNKLNERASKFVPDIIDYIHLLKKEYSLPLSRFFIGGFSQGGLMALKTAFALPEAVCGVIGMSAVPLAHTILSKNHLNILLTHGGYDPVIPLQGMKQNQQILEKMNQTIETVLSPYMTHGIDEICFKKIKAFIQKNQKD